MKEITAKEVQQTMEQGGKLNLIDVREVDEVEAGHIGHYSYPARFIRVSTT